MTAAHDAAPDWMPRDCHGHSTFSDGVFTPEEVVERGRVLGVKPSITDHLTRDTVLGVKTLDGVRAYLDALDDVARHAPELGRGGEFCWHDGLWRELPDDVWDRFTHTVGSLHAVWLGDARYLHMFQRAWPDDLDVDAYMELHVASIERLAREMPIDVFAHPTLMPIPLRERALEELWSEAHEERAVKALAAAGLAFEVSNRYRPHERFVRRAVDAGVRLSLGSDGHTPHQVANVAWPLTVTRAAGFPDAQLYDPSTHGRRSRESLGAR